MNPQKVFFATLVTIMFVTLITVAADLYLPLKNELKAWFWHHWVGKGILAVGLFALLSFAGPGIPIEKQRQYLAPVLALGTLAIFVFFTLHFLKVI